MNIEHYFTLILVIILLIMIGQQVGVIRFMKHDPTLRRLKQRKVHHDSISSNH